MPQTKVTEIELSVDVAARLFVEASKSDWPDLSSMAKAFRGRAHRGVRRVLTGDEIASLTEIGSDSVAVKLVGSPINWMVPTTPGDPADGVGKVPVACRVLTMLSTLYGVPYAMSGEGQDRMVHSIIPVEHDSEKQTSSNAVKLHMHAESGFSDEAPDYVVLGCLRQPTGKTGAATTLVALDAVLAELSHDQIEILFAPRFRMHIDTSLITNRTSGLDQPPFIDNLSVLAGSHGAPTVCADLGETTANPGDDRAADALSKFSELVHSMASHVRLAPGEILIVDNRVALHGRAAYKPNYGDSERWNLRIYLKATWSQLRSENNNAVIAPTQRRPGQPQPLDDVA